MLALVSVLLAGAVVGAAVASAGGPHDDDDLVSEPVQVGPEIEVATGETPGGEPWTLVAYDSNAGLCLEVRGVTPANGGGGGCGFDVPEQHSVSMNADVFGDPAVTVLYGPVAKDVDRVTLALSGGVTLDRPTLASPAGLGFNGRFYAELVPGAPSTLSITGTRISGLIVEQRTE